MVRFASTLSWTNGSRLLQVFIHEQGYYPEFDDLDATSAIHFVAQVPLDAARAVDESVDGSEPYAVATARIYQLLYKPEGGPPDGPSYPLEMVFCIGRVACLKAFRGHGIATLILEKAMSTAKRLGANRLVLHSQADKTGFYKRAGFTALQVDGHDWCFDEDKHPHVGMQLTCDAAA